MRKAISILAAMIGFAALATPAMAVKINDITRISGQRANSLNGWGLVVGLKGTGDGGEYMPAIKPLAAMLSKFGDATTIKEMANSQNVALVVVSATIPKDGVRDGDELDCQVSCVGAAQSLKGGRLFITPMQGPVPGSGIYAMSQGDIVLEDPSTPTKAVVKHGCRMETDLLTRYVEGGRFTLVLEDPVATSGWGPAHAVAQIINEEMDPTNSQSVAFAVDPKNVVVSIPLEERARPDSFISRVQSLPVRLESAEARVVINQTTGTMMFTGDVEIDPVVISHKGLTISTTTPAGAPGRGTTTRKEIVPLGTTGAGGAKLQDLVNALDQLKVPAEDRITIVKELYKTGKLHAKLLIE